MLCRKACSGSHPSLVPRILLTHSLDLMSRRDEQLSFSSVRASFCGLSFHFPTGWPTNTTSKGDRKPSPSKTRIFQWLCKRNRQQGSVMSAATSFLPDNRLYRFLLMAATPRRMGANEKPQMKRRGSKTYGTIQTS